MRIIQILKRKPQVISVSVFIIFCLLIYANAKINSERRKTKILKTFQITSGTVYSSQFVYKRGYKIIYKFKIRTTELEAAETSHKYDNIHSLIIGKSFPIIISTTDSLYRDLLVFPKDFATYNIPFPDSLSWVKEYE